MVACMSGSVLARGFGVLSSSWRDSLILFSFLTLFVNTWTLLMVSQIPGVSSSLAATVSSARSSSPSSSTRCRYSSFSSPPSTLLPSGTTSSVYWPSSSSSPSCLPTTPVSLLASSHTDVLFRQRTRMERIFRDGFNPYKHQTCVERVRSQVASACINAHALFASSSSCDWDASCSSMCFSRGGVSATP